MGLAIRKLCERSDQLRRLLGSHMTIKESLRHLSELGSGVSCHRREGLLGAMETFACRKREHPGLRCFYTRSRLMTPTDKPDRTPYSAAHDLCLPVLKSQ